MPFFAYILRCADGSMYTGHTEDLERRLAAHHRGVVSSYTRLRRPLTLAWCEALPTREEALAAERRIKGWTRAKKQALIAGDFDRLFDLSISPSRREYLAARAHVVGRTDRSRDAAEGE